VDWKAPGNRGVPATIRFSGEAAPLARDQFPNGKPGPKGSLIVRLPVWPGAGFYRFVLSWAGGCEVIEPEPLREGVAEYAAQVADAHDA
jgi:predicted DNA-binding transcriptional regulator YafY